MAMGFCVKSRCLALAPLFIVWQVWALGGETTCPPWYFRGTGSEPTEGLAKIKGPFGGEQWTKVTLPHTFDREQPADNVYGWYVRELRVPSWIREQDVLAELGLIDDADKTFVNGRLVGSMGAWGDAITTTDDNTIAVKSTGASGTNNDLSIKLTYQGTIEATITLDVRTPASATQSSLQDLPKQNGYETIIKYHVRDQFTESLPGSLECNEAFGAWTSEFPGETWPAATPTPSMTGAQYLADHISATGGGTPTPLNPGQPGADTRVQSAPQTFRLGSQTSGLGVVIKQHTLRYYRGKGRHE